jgi:hypothetical protein
MALVLVCHDAAQAERLGCAVSDLAVHAEARRG